MKFKVGDKVIGLIETSWTGVIEEIRECDVGVRWSHMSSTCRPAPENAEDIRLVTPLEELL